ncbi:MAG TPA: hypothetical protein VFT93_01525 [Candidatus Eisenbacteria bacterium]|nr:hypothetical protein [Candidatus Eisenbacteria bacterium]
MLFRVTLAVLALLIAARAGHEQRSQLPAWPLAALFAATAAALAIWPLLVPSRPRILAPHSLAPAFYIAGMFLLPPAALVAMIAFAITLSDLIRGIRAYRIVFDLSIAILAYVAPALLFSLGPRPAEIMFQPAARAGLELMIAASAVTLHLLLRSVALRLEHGEETPRWGAFEGATLIEAIYGLVLSVTILVLARIHPALLAVVYVQLGITTWLVRRYRAYVVELREEAERPKRRLKAIGERSSDGARREDAGRWWGKRASGSR